MTTLRKFWTLAEIIAKVEKDLDIEGEDFVKRDELIGYINEGIDFCESKVHDLNEDYFLSSGAVTLVTGTNIYDLPTDIYGDKIREISYRQGTRTYEIKRLRNWKKFKIYELDRAFGPQGPAVELCYMLLNSTPGAPQILFTPEVQETGPYVTIWYLRQANRLVNDSDVMDIPEAAQYIIQFAKMSCYEKEGHPNLGGAMIKLEALRTELLGNLQIRSPDNNDEIEMDLSIYSEMS